ncbi:iron-sulfur cluster assembly protein [Blattabacterium cuenoti]|uniref:iron-sulfur cluster assembly protein n=1 Tax=Blattabacterium cuenoti TaxID=1653831 RepID=UPI00163C71C1|nr:iron-sulfur cluster assembly protein [Blattabacterium cuenoti]
MNKDNYLEDRIICMLKSIYDPEIPVDIYELGLIYDIQISSKKEVKIVMTLTTPNCPIAEGLLSEVDKKVKSLKEIKKVNVVLTFDPPWSKEFMSEEARLELGFL